MAKPVTTILVRSCDHCPGLWQNMEYPETRCKFFGEGWYTDGNLWAMGYHSDGDPLPDKCPLRDQDIKVRLGV